MSRVLPGDLVCFKPQDEWELDSEQRAVIPKVQIVEPTLVEKKRESTMWNTMEETKRLSQSWIEMLAVAPGVTYLVLSASMNRSMLMRCKDSKYVVAFNKDLYILSPAEVCRPSPLDVE